MTALGFLAEIGNNTSSGAYQYSTARAVSADGLAIVGQSYSNYTNFAVADKLTNHPGETFRWTAATGMVSINSYADETSVATAIVGNRDAATTTDSNWNSIIVGAYRAWRWTATTGMVDLGSLGPTTAYTATGVSADGTVVVGTGGMKTYGPSGTATIADGFRWASNGPHADVWDLNTLLLNAGVNLAGITLNDATGISSDGQFITGDSSAGPYIVRYIDGGQAVGRSDAEGGAILWIGDADRHANGSLALGWFGLRRTSRPVSLC